MPEQPRVEQRACGAQLDQRTKAHEEHDAADESRERERVGPAPLRSLDDAEHEHADAERREHRTRGSRPTCSLDLRGRHHER